MLISIFLYILIFETLNKQKTLNFVTSDCLLDQPDQPLMLEVGQEGAEEEVEEEELLEGEIAEGEEGEVAEGDVEETEG